MHLMDEPVRGLKEAFLPPELSCWKCRLGQWLTQPRVRSDTKVGGTGQQVVN